MNITYLNTRCQAILTMLLTNDSYLSVQRIATELKVSQRSIYYDICKLNEWFAENGIPELEVVRGKGLFLSEEARQQIEDFAETGEAEDAYVYSPMERVELIICGIIYSATPVNIEQLTDYCKVSRNTIFSDLRVVVNQLQKYDLNLEYHSKKGYLIAGDVIKVRSVFLINFQRLQNLFINNAIRFIDQDKIAYYDEILKKIEKELGVEYIPENRKALAVLLPIMEQGDENLYFVDLRKAEMENSREYQLVEKYFPQFLEKEKIYLCLHLLGGRISTVSDDIFENTSNEMVYEITKALVSEFEKVACVTFDKRDELERQLFVHINASLYRYKYGIQTLDGMNEDIIREYPDLFDITKIVSRYLEKQIGLPIPDNEIAYLALHFGSRLPIANKKGAKTRVLIVCSNGMATGNMLRREITKMFPEAEVVGVKATANLTNAQAVCDIIVSTVKVKSMVPVVQVHPILTARDKELLMKYFRFNNTERINANGLFSVLKPYIEEKDQSKVKKLLEEYLYGVKEGSFLESNKNRKELLDVLDEQRIEIHRDQYKWTQALWMAGEHLIDTESIQASYIESIISQIRYYGPYMFITPRVILAHSKPEIGVNRMDCALHLFCNPVTFSENNQASIVIILAAEDNESHITILRDIMTIFEQDQVVDQLLEKTSPQEILTLFKNILEHKKEE
ncbi:MAG: BglG family transcription antiterminator [Eubacterium sp.]